LAQALYSKTFVALRHFSVRVLTMSSKSFNGFLSGASQYGRWIPEKEMYVRAFMGGSTVDFSHALFTDPIITIHSKAMWGGVTIIVPPDVLVEQNGRAIMGGFGGTGGLYSRSKAQSESAPTAGIVVKLYGTSVMGGITTILNKKAKPARLVGRAEAERLLREAPSVGATSQLDVVGDVLGGVFGGLVDKANAARGTKSPGAYKRAQTPTSAKTSSQEHTQQNVACKAESPALLAHARSTTQQGSMHKHVEGVARAIPTLQDWKQELKELKALLDEGVLTQSEFDNEKLKILQRAR